MTEEKITFELPHDGIVCGINVVDDIQDLFEILPRDSWKGPYEIIGELEKTVRGMKIRKAPRKLSIMYGERSYVIFELTSYMKVYEENKIPEFVLEYSASLYSGE